MSNVRDLLAEYLMKKRNPDAPAPAAASPFDVQVSNSTAPVAGMAPSAPGAIPFAMTGDPRDPSATETALAGLPPEPPQMPVDAPDPSAAPAPLAGPRSPAVPPVAGAGAPLPQNPADIVRAAMDRAPSPAPEAPAPAPAPAGDGDTGVSIIGKALAALGDARMAGAGQRGNFSEGIRTEEHDRRQEKRQDASDAMARTKFDQEQTAYKNAADPNSPESKFAQEYMAKLTGRDPKEFAGMNFQRAKELLPTVEKAWAAQEAAENRRAATAVTVGTKESQQQDRLEQQARQAVQSLRGDKSLADAEAKRDAAITVYKTIDQIKGEGRAPSKAEYYDLLGQMWKARTGSSPTDQAIKDLDTRTLHGDINKAASYFTGKPGGATTKEVLDNIQAFAANSGVLADQLHEGYMKTHLLKPQGLDEDRWTPIFSTGRGSSFKDATGYQGPESKNTAANEVRRKTADGRVIVYDKVTKRPLREESAQ